MMNSKENEIIKAEEKLRQAMLLLDVDSLGKLISARLIFTNHLG